MLRQEVQHASSSTYNIDLLSLNRWSPRYISGEERVDEDLMILLEAARKAFSSFNNQMCRFIYAKRDSEQRFHLLNLLNEDNILWAKDIAPILSCSALIVCGAIKNATLKPDDNVVIVGVGGLGLMVIQLAKAVTGAKVIAVDLDDDKLTTAKQNGADIVINSRSDDPTKIVKEMTQNLGADAVVDFVNSTKSSETDMQLLRKRARLVIVGLYGGGLNLNLVTMPTRAYRLIGSYTGSLNDLIELVSLVRRGIIRPVVSNRFKLNQATEALQVLKDGKIVGRGVINP
jgi:D-arabinose 1-dehydrogenase-like Zn-dependent alcohol dehydrogenase